MSFGVIIVHGWGHQNSCFQECAQPGLTICHWGFIRSSTHVLALRRSESLMFDAETDDNILQQPFLTYDIDYCANGPHPVILTLTAISASSVCFAPLWPIYQNLRERMGGTCYATHPLSWASVIQAFNRRNIQLSFKIQSLNPSIKVETQDSRLWPIFPLVHVPESCNHNYLTNRLLYQISK